jgi:gliding motility-associated-like protein
VVGGQFVEYHQAQRRINRKVVLKKMNLDLHNRLYDTSNERILLSHRSKFGISDRGFLFFLGEKQRQIQRVVHPKTIAVFLLLVFVNIVGTCPAQMLSANAGNDVSVCMNGNSTIGGIPTASGGQRPYSYSWQPAIGLNNSKLSNPSVTVTASNSYTLTVTDSAGNTATDVMNVTAMPLPTVSAGPDQTITSGANTFLNGSGAIKYFWTPVTALSNQNTASPVANPLATTTYCVAGEDANKCANYDCTVIVVNKSDSLLFYNSFTPNSDGTNDKFYIANIEAYPENVLEIFNRNGKLIYKAAPYLNNWNGEIDGGGVPCATYYYILYPGKGKAAIKGAVTIIR